MFKLELDIELIEKKLTKMERNRAWLARKIGVSNSSMTYIWRVKPISKAEKIAEILGIDPMKLIKKHQR